APAERQMLSLYKTPETESRQRSAEAVSIYHNDRGTSFISSPLPICWSISGQRCFRSALLVHLSGSDDADEREQGQRSAVEAGHGQFAGGADQSGEDERGETAEDRHAEAVGDRHPRAAHLDGEQLGQQ